MLPDLRLVAATSMLQNVRNVCIVPCTGTVLYSMGAHTQ